LLQVSRQHTGYFDAITIARSLTGDAFFKTAVLCASCAVGHDSS
jgi:hypothetical protein